MESDDQKNKETNEIQTVSETTQSNQNMKLRDYIPIYIPAVEKGLLDHRHREKRFLDFLSARPSKDWFLKFGFIDKLSPYSLAKRIQSRQNGPSPPKFAPGYRRQRFRVPFVRTVNWKSLITYCKNWAKHPTNMAFLVWLFFVAIGILVLFLLMTGLLNGAIPKSSQRKRWTEITNQILNALFTIMCLYQHPKLFHHLVLLLRWRSSDTAELRRVYCKNGTTRPRERIHIAVVVLLFHITCFAQYLYCALFWGYTNKTRPGWAVNLCMGLGIGTPIIAGLYMIYGPLGRKYEPESNEEQQSQATESDAMKKRYNNQRVILSKPVWIGGIFDCLDDLTVAYLSFFCTFCVFGWNMERLRFGNMYVHICTFILLCVAPFWVFNVAALNIGDETIRYVVGITGIILCVLGLLYGGFWRIQMRRRFKLPASSFCCGNPAVSDFLQWLFCWSCSLAQEVRTVNFYDIGEDSFYTREKEEEEKEIGAALEPLRREGNSGPSIKSNSMIQRNYLEDDVIAPPLPVLIQ
ncbi:uncharacterized protein [Typha latifolia]|uniref:uncharacterized protein n=1 Tax=Typha latifolia TaxID=4733 RepID=UPI003C2BB3F6